MQSYRKEIRTTNFSSRKEKIAPGEEYVLLERGEDGIILSPALQRRCGRHAPVSQIWFSTHRPVVELWLGKGGEDARVVSAREVSEAIDRIAGSDSCMAVIEGPATVMGRCVSFMFHLNP